MSMIEDLLNNISDSSKNIVSNVQNGVKNVSLQAKAEGTATVLQTVTGFKPVIVYNNNKAYLSFKKENIPALQAKLNNVMKIRKPTGESEINIAFEPVVYPVMIKKILPYAIGAVALGFVIGKVI